MIIFTNDWQKYCIYLCGFWLSPQPLFPLFTFLHLLLKIIEKEYSENTKLIYKLSEKTHSTWYFGEKKGLCMGMTWLPFQKCYLDAWQWIEIFPTSPLTPTAVFHYNILSQIIIIIIIINLFLLLTRLLSLRNIG